MTDTVFFVDPAGGSVAVILAPASPAGGGGFRETFKTRLYDTIVRHGVRPEVRSQGGGVDG